MVLSKEELVQFCFVDNLLIRFSDSGFGCYMRTIWCCLDQLHLLGVECCQSVISTHYNMISSSMHKSKLLVVLASHLRSVYFFMHKCVFSIGGSYIENVNSFSHLCHIINSRLYDSDLKFRIIKMFHSGEIPLLYK